ncbi:hypothetical protein Tco_0456203, partial [Tanacetum coccineum]
VSVVGVVRRWWCGRRGDVVVVPSVVVEAAKGWQLVLSWHGDIGGEGDGIMMVVRWASMGGRRWVAGSLAGSGDCAGLSKGEGEIYVCLGFDRNEKP